jgi:hypothetical protein
VNYTSESRRSYQFRHVGQCRALFKQRSARFEFTSDLLRFTIIFFGSDCYNLSAPAIEPLFKFSAAPAKPHVFSKPETWYSLLSRCAGTGVVPNPGFGDPPARRQLRRIDQFGAVFAGSGHQRDISRF